MDQNNDDVYEELCRSDASFCISSYINGVTFPPLAYNWWNTGQIVTWLVSRDYFTQDFLSGLATNLMVTAIQLLWSYQNAITVPNVFQAWVYHTNVAVLKPGSTYIDVVR